MSVRHIAMIPTYEWERLRAQDANREAAATSGRVANTDLRMLVGYRIVRAMPHRTLFINGAVPISRGRQWPCITDFKQ